MARVRLVEPAFELALQVRSYEVGRQGRLRPANILRYFEYLATEDSSDRGFDHAWYERNGSAWVVRAMRLRLGRLPGIGERLRMATWVSGYGRVQALREYALWTEADAHLVARGQARWGYVDRTSGRPTRIPEELSARILPRGGRMADWRIPPAKALLDAPPLRVVAREYEADPQQHVNNAVYVDWLEDANTAALMRMSGRRDLGRLALRRLHLEYLRPVAPGDGVLVAAACGEMGSRGVVCRAALEDTSSYTAVLNASALYARTALRGE